MAFTNPLTATVTTGGTPTSGVTVTFTAPAAEPNGTFAGMATATAMTSSSGVATSPAFTAGTTAGTYMVSASAPGATANASFSLTNTAGAAANLAATSGGGQSATVSTAFANRLVATVTDSDGNGVAGQSVTFTAPASGASGLFADKGTPAVTDTEMTDPTGKATSTVFTANATVGGPYNVVATSGTLTPVNFGLTNNAVVASSNYVFYLSGQEVINGGPNYYALAGAVTINSDGTVAGGEQDYNDGFGITSPTGGDSITGGMLTVDGTTGLGTLTLITSNTSVGVRGTETFGVQFVNTNHALIIQFDGSATSSGSMDLQTLPSTLGGGYAFTMSGVDPGYNPIGIGGVFSISGAALTNGFFDANDSATVTTNVPFTANVNAADTFGRGTITGAFAFVTQQVTLAYYIVGPKVLRIIDVDPSTSLVNSDSFIGSAFFRGAASFTNASLGSSVLVLSGAFLNEYGAMGQFSTNTTAATFTGVGEDDELDNGVISALASPISGTYSIGSDGYSGLTITGGLGGGDVSLLGVYMTDPTLNLEDPNNPTGGGGALVLDLDAALSGGTGVLTPQTDTSTTSFANSYAVGLQDFNYFLNTSTCGECEIDLIAQGSVTAGVLSAPADVDVGDPFLTLSLGGTGLYSGSTIAATPLADGSNPGRYSMLTTNTPANPVTLTVNGTAETLDVVMYQASGGQLYWLNYDTSDTSVFVGPLEQLGSLANLPAVRKSAAKTQTKQKHNR